MSSRKKSRSRPWTVALIWIIAASALVGVSVAKYIQTTTFTGTLSFNAKLAESIELLEHQAVRNADGSYTLNTAETVEANTYELIPGLDVPKDPFVRITNKTTIAAFLYVEVVDKTNGAISWKMTDNWLELDVTGKEGRTVYVYAPKNIPMPLDEDDSGDFPLLKDNMVYVSQELLSANPESGDILEFYAALGEVNAADGTKGLAEIAKDVYENLVNKVATQ